MSYLALYRKFRPTNFNEVIGQNAIVKTLTNQIYSNKIGHAYLFCGARGTGKTTLAKIFAKAVNCLDFKNGTPCGKCPACLSLADLSNVDIIEMDAASNNKVENVREIRESVQYPPINVKYKVYIIDEVHMLTPEAFNALLKTLEEPPKHAIFVLATTEPYKLPTTVLSRCMRFDFRLVSTREIADLIKNIYDKLNKKYEDDAINLIARAGEGSVRDALSIADLCLCLNDNTLTYKDASTVLGATDITKTNELVSSVLKGDIGQVLSLTNELYSLGKSIGVLLKDCVNYLRDLMVVKTCKAPELILNLPKDRLELLKKTSTLSNEYRILRVIEILSSTENLLRYSTQQRAVLESALLKATLCETDENVTALTARIKKLEDEILSLKSIKLNVNDKQPVEKIEDLKEELTTDLNAISAQTIENELPVVAEEKTQPVPPIKIQEKVNNENANSYKTNIANGKKIWGSIVRKLRGMPEKTILWVACQELTADLIGNVLYINAQSDIEKQLFYKDDNLALLSNLIKSFGDYEIQVRKNDEQNSVDNAKEVEKFFKDTVKVLD